MRGAHPELEAVSRRRAIPATWSAAPCGTCCSAAAAADIDLVVEGDAEELAARLGAAVITHERFGTAKVELDGHEVDIATRSRELPASRRPAGGRPGAEIEADLPP